MPLAYLQLAAAMALVGANVVVAKLLAEEEDGLDFLDDPLGIAVPWEEKYAKKTDTAAYAHAYVYSPADTTLFMNLIIGGRTVVWLNGKPVFKVPEWGRKDIQFYSSSIALPLTKGWNRLLVRTMPSTA